jgi:hypothetical protein
MQPTKIARVVPDLKDGRYIHKESEKLIFKDTRRPDSEKIEFEDIYSELSIALAHQDSSSYTYDTTRSKKYQARIKGVWTLDVDKRKSHTSLV